MKLNDIIIRSRALSAIRKEKLTSATRLKVVMNEVEYWRYINPYIEDQQKLIEKLKPEGFNKKERKFAPVLKKYKAGEQPTAEEKKKIEELKADPEYASFCEINDRVMKEFNEACVKLANERDYDVVEESFDDADLESITEALPSGEVIKVNGGDIPTDEALAFIVRITTDRRRKQTEKETAADSPDKLK